MIIRNSFLAILSGQPAAHGYGLKSSFESSTGGAWRLNAGQVYTTLSRLERDGLVASSEAKDEPERRAWSITERGQRVLADWYDTAVDDRSSRDELVIKVLVALASGEQDMSRVLQTQRSATMRRLQRYTRHKMDAPGEPELAGLLMLDAMILRAESEIRWLDLCEQRLAQRPESPPDAAGWPGGAP
ncbi:MAG: PadR family transcriptional regulator [Acidobacteriota bacterium]